MHRFRYTVYIWHLQFPIGQFSGGKKNLGGETNIHVNDGPACADPESLARGGPTLTTFFSSFFSDEGKEDPNSTTSWPSSARQRNAIFKWRADDGPTLNAGLVAL